MEYNITSTDIQGTYRTIIEAHHDADTERGRKSKVSKIQC